MRQIARREDIRDLILDAVDVLLAKFGYKKMTMEDVARQVGIGKGTIYLHFPGKEELILSHIDRIAERIVAKIREIAGSSDSPDRRIRKMLVHRVLFRFDSVAHYSQNLSDLLSSVRTALLTRREAHFEKEAAVFEDVLREGARLGTLECSDPRTTSFVLIQSTNSLLPFSLSARELGRREEVEDQVGRVADLLIKGLLSCPSRPASWTR
ncbi:MAG: TetR/AcrR family transcriptional regulator [Candidatus Aminicenantes bacterium]|nr:TetR/AcrR family transcriptional regulator [Candidatus Aminicenantes bacterium]TFG57710.1 MAG: TetR/AcrR family transcriptional regulator [Candidatus Aminicenantes bacterium]